MLHYELPVLGKVYSWRKKEDVDDVNEKFIFLKDIQFQSEHPAEVTPGTNIDEHYEQFIQGFI